MGIYLNPGKKSFTMATNSEIYIDKTMLIHQTNRVINTEKRFVCVSRPRRFGKSIAANMLVAYYGKDCDSSTLFADYKIAKTSDYRKHLNQYNVIRLDMQNFLRNSVTISDFIHTVETEVLAELMKAYPECDIQGKISLSKMLSMIYVTYQDEFVFVLDEWDCPLRVKKYQEQDQTQYLDFIRDLFKNREYVALVYMTGILPIKKYGEHSALNMFDEYSMIDQGNYAEYVGFTETEVNSLCKGYDMSFQQMSEWYDGYYFRGIGHIYSPRSVVEAISRRYFDNYWTQTETYEALKVYMEMNFDGLKDSIISMLAGDSITLNTRKFQNDMTTFQSRDDVLTLLIHLGYLAYDQNSSSVYIPNQEIQREFENAIEGEYWADVIDAMQESEKLIQAVWNMDTEYIAKVLDKKHDEYTSILKYNDENSLTCVLSIAFYVAINYYHRFYELPTGKGFADIAFIPKRNVDKPALIIELKYDKSAQGAIEQIKNKQYIDGLREYQDNMLLVGINYDKNSKEHTCVIEKV